MARSALYADRVVIADILLKCRGAAATSLLSRQFGWPLHRDRHQAPASDGPIFDLSFDIIIYILGQCARHHISANEGKRMGSRPRRLAILSFVVSMSAIGLRCASAEECDYKTCGALMARDASVSWAVSGPHDYSPDTKRACAEFNACVRRAKNNAAGRAGAAPAVGSNAQNKKSASPPPTTPIPAEVNAPKKQPQSPPPTTPTATQENTPNASPPPATKTIPFPD